MLSTIDLQNAYHQVPLLPESRDLTSFITHDGMFCFTRVPFGLASAPSPFQRMMTRFLSGLDDVIMFASAPDFHEKRLKDVLHQLHNGGPDI